MARYIDADKLEKDFLQSVSKHNVIINGNEYPVFLVDHVLHKIRNYPTAMDGQAPQKLNHNSLCETETYKVGGAE